MGISEENNIPLSTIPSILLVPGTLGSSTLVPCVVWASGESWVVKAPVAVFAGLDWASPVMMDLTLSILLAGYVVDVGGRDVVVGVRRRWEERGCLYALFRG